MAQTKYTDTAQQQRKERLAALRATRKDLAELAGLKISPEWAKLVRLLERWATYAKSEEARANVDHDSGEIDAVSFSRLVTRARQKAADFEFVVDILKKTTLQAEMVEAEIARLEAVHKEAKEVLA